MANGEWRMANGKRWEWAVLVVILLAAAFLRLYRLDAVPPGLTHDEAGHVHDATAIAGGARPIYQTVGYGREPLYDYLGAGLIAIGIPAVTSLRLLSVVASLITLAVTFLWTREAFDGPTALLATALQAASFWSLAVSRQALRSSLLLPLFAVALYLFWRAVYPSPTTRGTDDPREASGDKSRKPWALMLFTLLLGATLYTYIPARVVWLLFPAFLIYLALYHRPAFRRIAIPALVAIGAGLLLSAPLFLYLHANPGLEQRLDMLDEPLRALAAGDFSVVLKRAASCLAAFVVPGQGDDFLAYNTPGRPFLDPITGGLFLAGVVICLIRMRHSGYAMALLWFAVSISPSLVTGAAASTTRSITALPATFLFPAIAVMTGARGIVSVRPTGIWRSARSTKSKNDETQTRWRRLVERVTTGVVIVFVIANGILGARDYHAWGRLPEVRAAYMHTLVQTAEYLDAAPESSLVALSTALPLAPHDPYVFDASLRRSDLSMRWFNGQGGLIVPNAPTARLIAPAVAPLDPYFADLPGLAFRERVSIRPDDLNPFFDVYDWTPPVTREALLDRAQGTLLDLALPVDLDGALSLLGYDLRTPVVAPEQTVELITLWQVTDPTRVQPRDLSNAEQDLVFFTHALDVAGTIAGQDDRLDGPAWSWQTGDVVVQIHRFALPGSANPETLTLVVGVYRRSDMTRLPVRVDSAPVGDVIQLAALEVRAP
ncbi:MAG: ArnT family glycosyltransferase [Anaerolineae bacterium]